MIEARTELPLGAASRAALEESSNWVSVAQRRLGELYSEYSDARDHAERLEIELRKQLMVVRESEAQHTKIVGIVVDSLNLPPGDGQWVYDANLGSFVKEDAHV